MKNALIIWTLLIAVSSSIGCNNRKKHNAFVTDLDIKASAERISRRSIKQKLESCGIDATTEEANTCKNGDLKVFETFNKVDPSVISTSDLWNLGFLDENHHFLERNEFNVFKIRNLYAPSIEPIEIRNRAFCDLRLDKSWLENEKSYSCWGVILKHAAGTLQPLGATMESDYYLGNLILAPLGTSEQEAFIASQRLKRVMDLISYDETLSLQDSQYGNLPVFQREYFKEAWTRMPDGQITDYKWSLYEMDLYGTDGNRLYPKEPEDSGQIPNYESAGFIRVNLHYGINSGAYNVTALGHVAPWKVLYTQLSERNRSDTQIQQDKSKDSK